MNKDYMLLNDNTIEVTNEEGIEINRGEFKNNNVKGILLAENKIEITEELKKRFDKEINENNEVLKMSSKMLKFQVFIFVGLPLFGFLYGAITNPDTWLMYAISESIYAFAGSLIPISTAAIYWSIIRPKYKKNIKDFNIIINKTENMKKEYEKELEKEKEKVVSSTLEPLVKVSIEKETNEIAKQVSEKLIDYCNQNIKQRGKVKVRKR